MSTSYTFADFLIFCPEAAVLWDIQGGNEWVKNYQPRFYFDYLGGIQVAIGRVWTGVGVDVGGGDDWDSGFYCYIIKKWAFGTEAYSISDVISRYHPLPLGTPYLQIIDGQNVIQFLGS